MKPERLIHGIAADETAGSGAKSASLEETPNSEGNCHILNKQLFKFLLCFNNATFNSLTNNA